jgi:ABC-type multidrug transport system fused ATPase/permease subunit
MPLRGELRVDGLAFNRAGTEVLADVSFASNPGTTTTIVGSTGEDHASLLGLLRGLYPPSAGTIRIDGADLAELPLCQARSLVALALEEPWLVRGTVAENISFGLARSDRARIEQVTRLACLDGLPGGLEAEVGYNGARLTPAQRRRLSLARALLRDPSLLLIEEPTKGLDARETSLAIRAVNRAGQGRTTVVVTRGRQLTWHSDQVFAIDRGKLVATSPDEGGSPHRGQPR